MPAFFMQLPIGNIAIGVLQSALAAWSCRAATLQRRSVFAYSCRTATLASGVIQHELHDVADRSKFWFYWTINIYSIL